MKSRYYKPHVARHRVRRYLYKPPPANHPLLLSAPFIEGLPAAANTLPSSMDLRNLCLAIRQQGHENACSGFAAAAFRELSHAEFTKQALPSYLSPAYLYAKTRIDEGTFPDDAGSSVADEFTILANQGTCPEAFCPFDDDPSVRPPPAADVAAVPFRITNVSQVKFLNPTAIKSVLALRQSIAIGFTVYDSFEKPDANGVVPVPGDGENFRGGHSVLVCGYDDDKGWWIVRNQYGTSWGDGGYCYMPYGYENVWHEAWTAPNQ